ncbi:MAG: phosphoglucosamine mutase [Oscillospiraceae bacterium]|nr:phosphoglucosamine mutase [Oscillospiraceae bacterium]
MARMFGTDGVRGIANRELTCEMAFQLGQAGARALASSVHRPTLLIGRDTRISGEMLEAALVAGICAQGARPVLLGVLPTPGIAYLTKFYEADAGVVLSASHNAVEYNGIKFFDGNGRKLPDAVEDRIEAMIREGAFGDNAPIGKAVGRPVRQVNAARQYIEFLKSSATCRLDGLHLVLDCAHGAASAIAPQVFAELGAQVSAFYHEPDGTNINENCGSTDPSRLQELVSELGADAGLAFDGDADRLIAVDDRGQLVDGDHILAICAIHMKKEGKLAKNTVVSTVMSNMGLEIALKDAGIGLVRTKVGDRYVLEKMLEEGYVLGGEQSGHIIFLEHNATGDGIGTAIQLTCIMAQTKQALSRLARVMRPLPQATVNAHVAERNKEAFATDEEIQARVDALTQKYQGRGRTLVRPSGTEPLVRVMLEGPDQREIERDAYELARFIEGKLKK